jgi:hypothetical protein
VEVDACWAEGPTGNLGECGKLAWRTGETAEACKCKCVLESAQECDVSPERVFTAVCCNVLGECAFCGRVDCCVERIECSNGRRDSRWWCLSRRLPPVASSAKLVQHRLLVGVPNLGVLDDLCKD